MTTFNTTFGSGNIPVVVGTSPIEKRYAATEAQLEVWLSSLQSVEANCAYNEVSSLVFRGDLNVEILKSALAKVVERHSALRSTFSADGLEVLISKSQSYDFSTVDFSRETPHGIDDSLLSVVQNQARTPFDLVNGPLLRVVLQKLPNSEHRLTVTAHHLVLDGWSLAVFCQDLGYFYDSLNGKQRDALPPANHYHEYAEAMDAYLTSDDGKADEAYWVEQFTDHIPVLDLPTERARPSLRTYYGRRYDHQLDPQLVERLRKIGAKSGCSLFNIMLASFNAYVARISGNDDFCVGIPTAGQAAMDQPELMGHCVNTMPLRNQVDVSKSFSEYMVESRKSLLDAFDHQRYSYGSLLRKLAPPRDPSRPPMLSVSFNIDPIVDVNQSGFDGLDVELLIEPRSFENFEWFINGVIQKDKSIELQVQYNSSIYSTVSMQFYFEGFETFLNEIADEPTKRIHDFNVMSIPQRQKTIVDWNATELDYPIEATLHSEFSRQAKATPENVAAKFGDTEMTYCEVESRSNQIARYLKSQGVEAGDLVGICVNRSAEMLVNLFGIMKAGAGYVPLDPAYPSDRLQYMCDHSGLKLIVTESELNDRVAEFGKTMIAIDSVESEIQNLDSSGITSQTGPTDICYVIYTSGSTGKPKGVQVPHGAVVNFLYAMQQTPGFTEHDSVLAVTTLSFDIAVLELYLPTISGGTVVVLDSATAADGVRLAEQIKTHNISLLQATPATWRMLVQAGWSGTPNLKVLCGGEPMPQDLVEPLLERCSELWNMYGPTETTVWSAAFQITSATAPILIGKPIGNTQVYVLDANGNEVPAGCEGEIFIGGAGVTLGYRNQPDMTSERFVDNRYRNPFTDFVSDKLYKTGDLGRFRFDGNIQFLRRNDKQVKVRGFRIELGEIEQNLKSHPSVAQNVVVVRETTPGDTRLVAYLIANPGTTISASQLRDHLRESVPYYMVPHHFVELEAMPQTNNGKIDYKALPAPSVESSEPSMDELAMPETASEKFLAGIWEESIGLEGVALNDTFFDIGGHSLLVMKVIAEVNEKTGVKLGPQDFLICTLEQMADKISESHFFAGEPKKDEQWNSDSPAPSATSQVITQKASVVENPQVEETQVVDSTSLSQGVFRKLTGFWNEDQS